MLIRTYVLVAAITLAHSVLWCGVAFIKKRNDVADVAWGLGFLIAAAVSFFAGGFAVDRGFLMTGLTALWSLRLSFHIYARNRGKGEDYRYLAWRQEWGKWFYVRTFFQVFVMQWLLMLLVAIPVIVANVQRGGPATPWDILGTTVWLVGYYFEAVSDQQLLVFSRKPSNHGKLLTTGLWRFSRHPNFFGEVAQWWGLALIAFSVPQGWLGLIGAASINFLILKVSGIPLLEERMARKPGYEKYAERTSAFIPWISSGRRS